jgi:hypothetical protein
MNDVASRLANPIAKLVLRILLRDGSDTVAGNVVDTVKQRFSNSADGRIALRNAERIARDAATRIAAIVEHERYRGLPMDALVAEVTVTLEKIVSIDFLVRNNLDPQMVFRSLKDIRSHKDIHLSGSERAMYEKLLAATAEVLCEIGPQLPDFDTAHARESLRRLDQLANTRAGETAATKSTSYAGVPPDGAGAGENPEALQRSFSILHSPFFDAKRRYEGKNGEVFVIMPFSESWSRRIWQDHIKRYVREFNPTLVCKRGDDLYGHDVMQDVFYGIMMSNAIIADLTGRNANVFYELGLCHSVGKDTLLITQRKDDIPFDLLRFRHCFYQDNSDGYLVLRDFIRNKLGDLGLG